MSTSVAAATEPGPCPCGLSREEVRNFLTPVTALCTALGADGNPCNRRWADHPREEATKRRRVEEDCSNDTIRQLCVPFDDGVLDNLVLLKEALTSRLEVKIPFSGPVDPGSGLSVNDVFTKAEDDKVADFLVARFKAFEFQCKFVAQCRSEEAVLTCITAITGTMWTHMAGVLPLTSVFSFSYNKKDMSGATGGDAKPDETDYLNSFLVCKSEHKVDRLTDAINDLTSKLTGYNVVDYGTKIVYLPVIAVGGTLVEFAVIDVRNKDYHQVRRLDIGDNICRRVDCFVMAINFFRYFRTMEQFIPSNPTPLFIKGTQNVDFYLGYVRKRISESHTCPAELYNLLGTGSVPCAVKVEKRKSFLKISPSGVRTPDQANDFSLKEVKSAIKSVLTCLNFLHSRGFVHRDIRWANLIRRYSFRADGSIASCQFLVIDFEFADRAGEEMRIHDYIFAAVVPFGTPYHCCHDLTLVGILLKKWANYHSIQLDRSAENFIRMVEDPKSTASAALTQEWLQEEE